MNEHFAAVLKIGKTDTLTKNMPYMLTQVNEHKYPFLYQINIPKALKMICLIYGHLVLKSVVLPKKNGRQRAVHLLSKTPVFNSPV
ncbi:MAG: hypothetical protein ABI729_06015 [Chitinophagales bacterium]